MKQRGIVKKICILGDPSVGKTSLVGRYVLQQFGEEYISTIGARVCEKKVGLELGGTPVNVELVIWDIAGQNQFTSVTPSFYRGAEGALIVCDPSRRETFCNLFRWDHQFRENAAAQNAVLIFNKSDISDRWEITKDEAEALAGQLGYPPMFASAKTGHNVEESFIALVRRMLEKAK
jgi:small GTP-binding protein